MLKLRLLILFIFIPVIVFAQEKPWRVSKSTHFLVFYNAASEELVNQLTEKAEGYYNEIADLLGLNRFDYWTWDKRAKIYLFDTPEEYKKANSNLDWSVGLVTVGNKSIQSYLTAPGLLDNVLPHELAHIIFREMVGFNNPAVPLWLDEGVAIFHERRSSNQSVKRYLAKKLRSDALMNLSQLYSFDLVHAKDKQSVELFYFESCSLLDYLISVFGKDKFMSFCQHLRDYRDLTRALRATYSFDSQLEFENSWKAYILK